MSGRPGRRQVLAGIGALAVAPTAGRRRSPDPAPSASTAAPHDADLERFAWGVASFDPTAEGVLLWTRVRPDGGGDEAGGSVELRWSVAADPDLSELVAEGTVVATDSRDHCATATVEDLPAGGRWWYRFEVVADGATSPVGRTRTLPAGPVDRLRIAAVSCSRFAAGGFAAYRTLAEREVDLVVHLGDYIYEDGGGSGARAHDPPERLRTLAQYRQRYAQHRADPDLQALHALHPMVAVWDDHEMADNAWRDGARAHDDDRDGPWDERRRAATQAHEEWVPGRTRTSADGRLEAWRSVPLGDLAELVVLDTRSHRDRAAATAAEMTDGTDRRLLGEPQQRWMEGRLTRPDRPPWVLVANQVMLHPLRVPVPVEALARQIEEAGFLVVDGEGLNPDQWDGYPQDRDTFVAAAGGTGGVVVLTGDAHSSWAWEGPGADTEGQPSMVELVTPSVTSETFGARLPVPAGVVEGGLRATAPTLSHVELTRHGYLLVDIGPDELQAEWWYVDPADPSSHAFGAARRTGRAAPMHLEAVDEPLRDPEPTTTTTAPTTLPPTTSVPATTEGPSTPADRWPLVGGATAAVVAAGTGAAVALRRRRVS